MIGQTIDYNIEVDGGKSKKGVVISFYTGNFISISEYGTLVFHTGAKQKIIYSVKKEETTAQINIDAIIEEDKSFSAEEQETLKKEIKAMNFKFGTPEPKRFEVEEKSEEPTNLVDAIFGEKIEEPMKEEIIVKEEVKKTAPKKKPAAKKKR